MSDAAQEKIFQNDILDQMQSKGWLLGESNKYNKELALYPEDVIAVVADLQVEQNSTTRSSRIVRKGGFVR
ncbi:hypothetical protein [Vibrio cholerae]|uniref:hypothetical protein n=1 Tax=Vibrio cholerae TaxID=666 RepID=UPI0006643006|nr:hypothetical protein [Vibrio cholerae]CRZ54336.1 type I restriction enzyme%2C R subunit [Vibrio cholerae]CSC23514.1 type I restriction enzyme%2C R subunit [Vibrio cholerae]CSC59079.1 type I restriction enzyme%2C R subunit [Vibrio cholerae]HAS4493363.1 hypothetical protein [Vibrio cholerae]